MSKKKSVPQERGRKWPVRPLALVGAVLLAFGAFEWYRAYRTPGAVLPLRPESMDANVSGLIQTHIDAVNQDRSNAELHGRLGIAYEANSLYSEALASFDLAARLDPGEPVWRHHAAMALLKNGLFEPALERMRKLTQANGAFAPAQQRLGIMLLESGDFEAAGVAFRRTTALLPNAPEGHVGLAQVALAGNDYARALVDLEKALSLDPDYGMIHFLLGKAYRGLGRMQEAEREMTLGVDATERQLPDRMTGKLGQLVGGLSAQLSRGGDLLKAGRSAEAVIVLEAALRDRPNDINVINNLAVACIDAKQFQRAIELLERVRKADEDAFPTYINLAACFLQLGRAGEGLAHAKRAVVLAPQVGQTHHVLGGIYLALGRQPEAIEALEKALSLDQQNFQAMFKLAEAYMKMGRLPDARVTFETVTRRAPALLLGHLKLGAVCTLLGDLDAAESALQAAQRLAPADAGVKGLAREIALRRGR
jgi:tetratricopeptide (TPR) repeat protein